MTDIDIEEKCGDLGYGIKRTEWGKGIASEVAEAVIEQLKKDGFAYVHATVISEMLPVGE